MQLCAGLCSFPFYNPVGETGLETIIRKFSDHTVLLRDVEKWNGRKE